MKYSSQEVMQFVKEDVKFIRLAFCDIYGKQKNISIMPGEIEKAFRHGIPFNPQPIAGFGDIKHLDLYLMPDPDTLSILPWRPDHGRVVRMYCSIRNMDGSICECDSRSILSRAVEAAKAEGITFSFGTRMEFYLFKCDENGERTLQPHDHAGYMDIAPDDRGENIRREIDLSLEQMNILPESSYHKEGPGQHEIDFRYADPLTAADDETTFKSVLKTIADRNGLYADFSPKPLKDAPGNGFHITIGAHDASGHDMSSYVAAGILNRAADMSVVLNPSPESYERLGNYKAPGYVTWSAENRSQLINLSTNRDGSGLIVMRSPDAMANPYLAFALLIYAGLEGIRNQAQLCAPVNTDLDAADDNILASLEALPASRRKAAALAKRSIFMNENLPRTIIEEYCR